MVTTKEVLDLCKQMHKELFQLYDCIDCKHKADKIRKDFLVIYRHVQDHAEMCYHTDDHNEGYKCIYRKN